MIFQPQDKIQHYCIVIKMNSIRLPDPLKRSGYPSVPGSSRNFAYTVCTRSTSKGSRMRNPSSIHQPAE